MKLFFCSSRREEALNYLPFTIYDLRAAIAAWKLACRSECTSQSLVTSAAKKIGWIVICSLLLTFSVHANSELPLKQRSAFYPAETLATVRKNLKSHPEGERLKSDAIKKAEFWQKLSDDELWDLMFGPKITRSWMVWSNGDCPSCKQSVPMYTWIMNPQKHRWKTQCPHCKDFFPKNDFGAFYKSGLDEHGVFDPNLGDRKLLFNREHPDANDPLHQFGVDDGEGYVEEGKRWRFIGAYLIYGQFKKLVLNGIESLATAYVYTGDPAYARKAGILLDRVADVYPGFNYASQGLVYETAQHNGYVSVWHDACEETRELALAYDRIFEGIKDNKELVGFLSRKAEEKKLPNSKKTFAEIQQNIESGVLRDALKNKHKIHSNFPRAECTIATIKTVLGWPENRTEVEAYIDTFIARATAVDGVTGEKGLSGYSSYTISGLASFLAEYSRAEPDFLSRLLERQPALKQTYRFHIDTLCLDRYYPNSGDCGSLDKPIDRYVGAHFPKLTTPTLAPSMFSFFWKLYESTGDPAYVQILHRENGRKLDGLPHDLLSDDPTTFRKNVAKVINREGAELKLGSVNKEAWRIAILRSGKDENARALWLDYDSGGAHGHHDGMTIGLFAHGLDLMPEFGYPPVQFGGWTSPRARWYLHTAAHNTVVVNGSNHQNSAGQTTLWADGKTFRAIRASCLQMIGGTRYERTVALMDVSETEFYVFDLFQIAGGADHAKFVHGPIGKMSTSELKSDPVGDFGFGTQTRNFQQATNSPAVWSATWKVADRHKILPAGKNVSFRYTDLSINAQPHTAEAWIAPYFNSFSEETWNPILMIRRKGEAPLASTFVGVLEAFSKKPTVSATRRLPLFDTAGTKLSDFNTAAEIELQYGYRDLLIAADLAHLKNDSIFIQPQWQVKFSGDLAWIRRDARQRILRVAFCNGRRLEIGNTVIEAPGKTAFVEIDFSGSKPRVISGSGEGVHIR